MGFKFGRRSGGGSGAGFRDAPSTGKGRTVGFLFGLPFFLMGAAFCWFMGLQPIVKVLASGQWPQVPCVIAASEVKSHRSSDGTTYSIQIQFRYDFEGREFTGGSYDFNKSSSSGSSGKREVVQRYPVGKETLCWVNPSDPSEAVLSRNIPGMVYFVIPFTSVFMLVGLGISLGSLGLLPGKWKSMFQSRHTPVEDSEEGERWLKPSVGGIGKFIGSVLVALFWNGIVSIFVTFAVKSFLKGNPEWFLTIFIIPFVLIGLGMIGSVFYYFVALFNPKIELRLSEARPRLGERVRLDWRSKGSVQRLDSLTIVLEGREAATYGRGSSSVTDHSTFYRSVLFETDKPAAHGSGETGVIIPADSMHTFQGGNNKIEWRLRVRGPIRRRPDVDESYPITIRRLKAGNPTAGSVLT